MNKRYSLRRAAGSYWLLDLSQEGRYQPPVPLNESGARMFALREQGMDTKQLAGELAAAYGIGYDRAAKDIELFFEQLKQQGITC